MLQSIKDNKAPDNLELDEYLRGYNDGLDLAVELGTEVLTQVIDQYIEVERMYKRTENAPRSTPHIHAAGQSIALGKVLHLLTGVDFFEWDKLVHARRQELTK